MVYSWAANKKGNFPQKKEKKIGRKKKIGCVFQRITFSFRKIRASTQLPWSAPTTEVYFPLYRIKTPVFLEKKSKNSRHILPFSLAGSVTLRFLPGFSGEIASANSCRPGLAGSPWGSAQPGGTRRWGTNETCKKRGPCKFARRKTCDDNAVLMWIIKAGNALFIPPRRRRTQTVKGGFWNAFPPPPRSKVISVADYFEFVFAKLEEREKKRSFL